MAGFVNSNETRILDDFTGKTAFTPPTTLYLALSTATPTESAGSFTEPSNGGYIRQTLVSATWTTATAGDPSSTSYGGAVTFPVATGGWGTVTHWGLFSVATQSTGLVQFWATLDQAKAIQTTDTASFASGTLKMMLGDPVDVYA